MGRLGKFSLDRTALSLVLDKGLESACSDVWDCPDENFLVIGCSHIGIAERSVL